MVITTTTPEAPLAPPVEKSRKQKCLDRGGTWDEATQSCSIATNKAISDTSPPPQVAPEVKQTGPEIFTDPKTGRETGAVLPDGTTLLGLSFDDLDLIKAQEEAKAKRIEGSVPVGTARRQAEIEQERQRVIAEETPTRRELSPELGGLAKLPIIGGVLGVIADYVRPLKKSLGFKTQEGLAPEELRTLALSEIERQEIERGLTASEGFGRLVEATGLAKVDIFGLSAKDLIETPSANAREVKSNILKEKRRISNIETNVKLGYLPVSVANEQITDIEQNVQRLESRIRLLIYKSPELRFNSDYVNTVETEILSTREKAFQAKQNILTGATQNPTDIQILQKFQELQNEQETTEE